MYDLSLMNELGARTIIVMLPESFGTVADIIDSH
jgi:hypothetical protein